MCGIFPGVNKLYNIVGEVKNPNVFLRGVILRSRFSPGNFPGWIQPTGWRQYVISTRREED